MIKILLPLRHFFYLTVFCLAVSSNTTFAVAGDLSSTNPYDVLGVQDDIDDRGLTQAWKAKIKVLHPDAKGNDLDAQLLNEAYQFLKLHRAEYDAQTVKFRDEYKTVQSRALVVTQEVPTEEDMWRQALYHTFLSHESRARDIARFYSRDTTVFILHAIMKMSGAPIHLTDLKSWQVDAYLDLLDHLNFFALTNAEFTWITFHKPVEALEALMEHYDNFNVRFPPLVDLIRAYRFFYLDDDNSSRRFLELIVTMSSNESLYELKYQAFHREIVAALKEWIAFYLDKPRAERRLYREQYQITKELVLELEPFSASVVTCARLLLGLKPRIVRGQ